MHTNQSKRCLNFLWVKNTPERQEYIIRNLRFEHDLVDEEKEPVADEVISTNKQEAVAQKSAAA